MKKIFLAIMLLTGILQISKAQITYSLFASGLNYLSDIASCGDNRIFSVQKPGIISIFDSSGVQNPVPFMDISSRVNSTGLERGLLSLVFANDFLESGVFYVYYSPIGGNDSRISRFRISADPDLADTSSEQVIITIPQPVGSHYGGDMAFGKDGYLYIGLGDGGGEGDPDNHAQDTSLWLGKFLRIDVSDTSLAGYTIPPTNPFLLSPFPDEIWSVGFRNPWRWSFDRMTGDMWIGDVGQVSKEEIDFQPANSHGGENYGWRCYEGTLPYNASNCLPANNFVEPVSEYSHSSGCSVTGGFVYRGSSYHTMYGKYFYTDWCNAQLRGIIKHGSSFSDTTYLTTFIAGGVTFGEDKWGDLLVGTYTGGEIYRIYDPTAHHVAQIADSDTLQFCLPGPAILNTPPGYGFHYQWNFNGSSIGTDTSSLAVTQPGNYFVTVTNNAGLPQTSDTVFVDFVSAPTVSFINPDSVYCTNDPASGIIVSPIGGQLYIDGIQQASFVFDPSLYSPGLHLIEYTYTNSAGCTGSANQVVRIDACTGIDEQKENTSLLYPMPADNFITLNSIGSIRVFDLQGNRIEVKVTASNAESKIDVTNLQPGFYFCELRNGNKVVVKKFIKR